MKWWKIGRWGIKIEPVEVVKETTATITIEEKGWRGDVRTRRVMKGGYDQFFPTWEQARDCLLERALKDIERAKANLQTARTEEGMIRALTPPLDADAAAR